MPALIFICMALIYALLLHIHQTGPRWLKRLVGYTIYTVTFIGGFFTGLFFFVVWLIGAVIAQSFLEDY
jgi:hypothetical protein